VTSIAGLLEVLSKTLIVEAPHLTISILEAFVRQIITNRRRCYIVAHIIGWLWSRGEGRFSSEVVFCADGTGATVLQRSGNSRPSSWVEWLLNPKLKSSPILPYSSFRQPPWSSVLCRRPFWPTILPSLT
jgi:hypothetical protein